MKKRTSVNIENEYFFSVKHGRRNDYLEKIFEEKVEFLKCMMTVLRVKLENDKDKVIKMIKSAGMSAIDWEKNAHEKLSTQQKQALIILWEESTFAGIDAEDFVNILWGETIPKKKRSRKKT